MHKYACACVCVCVCMCDAPMCVHMCVVCARVCVCLGEGAAAQVPGGIHRQGSGKQRALLQGEGHVQEEAPQAGAPARSHSGRRTRHHPSSRLCTLHVMHTRPRHASRARAGKRSTVSGVEAKILYDFLSVLFGLGFLSRALALFSIFSLSLSLLCLSLSDLQSFLLSFVKKNYIIELLRQVV